MKQNLIFTALPNGLDGKVKHLQASVAISLQVMDTAGGTLLKNVPDMLNWPELINQAKFYFQLNGVAVEAKKISKPADTQLWKNLFLPTIRVDRFEIPDKTKIPILSYPVKHIVDYIKFIVDATGKKFTDDMPDANFYTQNPFFTGISNYHVNPLPQKGRDKVTLDSITGDRHLGDKVKRILKNGRPGGLIPFNKEASPEMDFAQLANFHGLYDAKQVAAFVQFKKPDFEFHDILSVIAQYPSLMRRLGLVIDFDLSPLTFLKINPDPAIRVYPGGLNFTSPAVLNCPGTAYEITEKGFYSKPGDGSLHSKGHVKINADTFTVFQLDTDGAALKLTSHIDALQLKKAKHIFYAFGGEIKDENVIPFYNNEMSPRREGLPSNRTAGISIARNGMAEYLRSRFERTNELKSSFTDPSSPPGVSSANATYINGTKTLYADDVNMGYRMDVKMTDKPGTPDGWHSLHIHNNVFSFLNSSNVKVEIKDLPMDEGFIQLSTTEDKNLEGPHMKLSEVIARWEGWSLSVPLPGKGLNDPMLEKNEVENSDSGEEKKYDTPDDATFRLNVQPVIAPGSLPKLRFGQTYAVKLRTVDIAGNSVNYDSAPENPTDAIASGIRYMRYEPVDAPFLVYGTSVRDGESSEVMVIRSNEGQTPEVYENSFAPHFDPISVRHVKPPRTTVGNAITHSMLEKAIGKGKTSGANEIYLKIKNEKDPIAANDASYNDAKVIKGDNTITTVEYLADPMAAGVSFFLSALDPNIKNSFSGKYSKRISFYFDPEIKSDTDSNQEIDYEKWMAPKPFRIILKEGNPEFSWSNDANRVVTISMPKGYMLKLNYACFWRPNDIVKLSGVLDMMGMNSLSDAVGQTIAKGQHWMFSPWRTLTFVHAIQQPATHVSAGSKKLPVINEVSSSRNFGETFSGTNIDLEVHGASTGVVDVEADWIDWVDDGFSVNEEGCNLISHKAKVYHFTSLYQVNNYVFGDFPSKNINNNPFKALPHQFNDTRHRFVNYAVVASTRYKEYFYNLIKENGDSFKITRESDKLTNINVLSSARPLAPQVAYVIPIFEWAREPKGDTLYTIRASGLRVYLKRPWFSSGQGEKLSVVVLPTGYNSLFKELDTHLLNPFFTNWGSDPTKLSAPLPTNTFPDKTAFVGLKKGDAGNVYTEDILSIEENDTMKVSIAAFDVKYDAGKDLHYADFMINYGLSYFPFIKLALAAYQQHSVRKDGADCCLSKIVHADYIQVPPARATSLKRSGASITVAISGTIPGFSQNINYLQKVQFVVEPIDIPASENVHITINDNPIDSYMGFIGPNDINNFAFVHSHEFKLPAEYATKSYRVKIFEYELISTDSSKDASVQPTSTFSKRPMKDRLVFADVYEVNTKSIISNKNNNE